MGYWDTLYLILQYYGVLDTGILWDTGYWNTMGYWILGYYGILGYFILDTGILWDTGY